MNSFMKCVHFVLEAQISIAIFLLPVEFLQMPLHLFLSSVFIPVLFIVRCTNQVKLHVSGQVAENITRSHP